MTDKEPAHADPQQQKQREVVTQQGDVADLADEQSPEQQVAQGHDKSDRGDVKDRLTKVMEPLGLLHEGDPKRHGHREQPDVPDQDD